MYQELHTGSVFNIAVYGPYGATDVAYQARPETTITGVTWHISDHLAEALKTASDANYADGEQTALKIVRETLATKARNLVELLDDAERNHGGLYSGKTLRAIGELRLELARWK